ncbi:MAG: DUF3276 family protein [Bacteroidales bacterium]|nr:DUF3276 family protein [Bacteroidales bacterium]
MYKEDFERSRFSDRNAEDIYSKPVRAGKRTYFFDVKSTKEGKDFYLTITESKRRQEQDGAFVFDKHKIFLYKEDFEKFQEGLYDAVTFIREQLLKGDAAQAPAQEQETAEGKSFSDVDFDEL